MWYTLAVTAAWSLIGTGTAQQTPKPWASKADEPRAETLSLAKSAAFLDSVTLAWIDKQQCASCHTGFP